MQLTILKCGCGRRLNLIGLLRYFFKRKGCGKTRWVLQRGWDLALPNMIQPYEYGIFTLGLPQMAHAAVGPSIVPADWAGIADGGAVDVLASTVRAPHIF